MPGASCVTLTRLTSQESVPKRGESLPLLMTAFVFAKLFPFFAEDHRQAQNPRLLAVLKLAGTASLGDHSREVPFTSDERRMAT